nr:MULTISPECIES: hypothetical protein [unclassified Streptomyces]
MRYDVPAKPEVVARLDLLEEVAPQAKDLPLRVSRAAARYGGVVGPGTAPGARTAEQGTAPVEPCPTTSFAAPG